MALRVVVAREASPPSGAPSAVEKEPSFVAEEDVKVDMSEEEEEEEEEEEDEEEDTPAEVADGGEEAPAESEGGDEAAVTEPPSQLTLYFYRPGLPGES